MRVRGAALATGMLLALTATGCSLRPPDSPMSLPPPGTTTRPAQSVTAKYVRGAERVLLLEVPVSNCAGTTEIGEVRATETSERVVVTVDVVDRNTVTYLEACNASLDTVGIEVRLAGPLGSRVLTVNGRQVTAQAIDDPLPFSPATTVTARR